jgi:diadenosine tetraphosphatase ApaH/serine/threonine PP2A family protein phosphatase
MMQTRGALFVHGSVRDPDEYIINSISAEENLEVLTREYPNVPVCFYGHTHVKAVAPSPNGAMNGGHTLDLRSGGPYLVNPGSVGQPRDGDTFASYVLADEGRIVYRFVEYDIPKAQTKIRAARRPPRHARRPPGGRALRTTPRAWNPLSPNSSRWMRRTPSFPG